MRYRNAAILVIITALLLTGCGPLPIKVSGKRFGGVPEDARDFVAPNQVKLYQSEDAAWNALENGYVYKVDNWSISDEFGQKISGGVDTWLMPSETQHLIDTYSPHMIDCEDGAAWLTSALRKLGDNAWLCVGTVTLDSGTYGHAWTMVLDEGKWTTYETTTGQIVPELPSFYSLSWRTDGNTVFQNILTGTPVTTDDMSPGAVVELRGKLGG